MLSYDYVVCKKMGCPVALSSFDYKERRHQRSIFINKIKGGKNIEI